MEVNRHSAAKSHLHYGAIVNERQPATPELGTATLDVVESRFPPEGWMVAGEGQTVLRCMKSYIEIISPKSEPEGGEKVTRLSPSDEASLETGELFALQGAGQLMLITSPAQRIKDMKPVGESLSTLSES